jgi:hypothetical protein
MESNQQGRDLSKEGVLTVISTLRAKTENELLQAVAARDAVQASDAISALRICWAVEKILKGME